MKYVLSENQGHHVGRGVSELLQNCICRRTDGVVVGNIETRKRISLCGLETKLLRITLADRRIREIIQLRGKTKSGLVDETWRNRPNIGHLRIVVFDVSRLPSHRERKEDGDGAASFCSLSEIVMRLLGLTS